MSDGTQETQAQPKTRHELQQSGGAVSRWLPLAALLVAVVAVALSIWAITSAPSRSSASDKLPGDPKVRVCTAFNTVSEAVRLRTNADLGPEPVAQEAVAANARLALVGGGEYLLTRLDAETPAELADPVRSFANGLQDIGIFALAGVPNTEPQQADRLTEADLVRKQIIDVCK